MSSEFLPCTRREMNSLGWDRVDIVLITGDAYVDHPAFGIAIIGRWLEANGFRVAVLAQPRHHGPEDFTRFGQPRLFFGISAGNMDSIVSNYTGNARIREKDMFSPAGNPYWDNRRGRAFRRRPDRACIRYSNLAKAAYPEVPVILGGVEASLRRFVHYDYQQEKLRSSVLTDAKADLLVYGMGERAVLEVAERIKAGQSLEGIAGTCERLTSREFRLRMEPAEAVVLPSWQEIASDTSKFLDAELEVDAQSRTFQPRTLVQAQKGGMHVWQNPPAAPLCSSELDTVYELPYARAEHPAFRDVPAYRMIRHSVTIVRGCCGNCSFCAIARHQGPVSISRSIGSVVKEVRDITALPDFRGTITDLGGPTANLFGSGCRKRYKCTRRDCLFPAICRHFKVDEQAFLDLLSAVQSVPGVKNLFVSSGLRMELLNRTPLLLKKILAEHTPGVLKIAPEHTEDYVLALMHKPGRQVLEAFLSNAREAAREIGKHLDVSAYFITSHPGCTMEHMFAMKNRLLKLGLPVRKFQDFTPVPGVISTAMYVTGLDRYKKAPIYVAKRRKERMAQRKVLESIMKRHLRPVRRHG